MSEENSPKEMQEADSLPPVDETSADYKAGFETGVDLQPLDETKSLTWQRGWADAED
ncbi:hypothetical protein [Granulicella sibirica]|uniref:Uncharacterized protein n=1 Tax=Granulicella sibirica TaxID=2479048 RepID=A0A4Q0SX69_9BACT|nr:hypothetical protein [Granulicella sibirica]RXH54039.1 hypothetical protein GRAN_5008 [Granulicella sibirica]